MNEFEVNTKHISFVLFHSFHSNEPNNTKITHNKLRSINSDSQKVLGIACYERNLKLWIPTKKIRTHSWKRFKTRLRPKKQKLGNAREREWRKKTPKTCLLINKLLSSIAYALHLGIPCSSWFMLCSIVAKCAVPRVHFEINKFIRNWQIACCLNWWKKRRFEFCFSFAEYFAALLPIELTLSISLFINIKFYLHFLPIKKRRQIEQHVCKIWK